MAVKDDDIVSMVLQAKREHEAILKQNESLRIRCHALETECEQLREESEGLHIGGHHHFRVPTPTGCRCQMMSVYPQPSALTEENLSKDELTSITLLQKLPSWHTSLARQDPCRRRSRWCLSLRSCGQLSRGLQTEDRGIQEAPRGGDRACSSTRGAGRDVHSTGTSAAGDQAAEAEAGRSLE